MFLLVCIVLVCFPQATSYGAREGLKTALEVVIPSILPFFVFAQGLLYTNMGNRLGVKIAPLFKFLHLNPNGAVPFIASLLAGYPTGAKVVCEMHKTGMVEKDEAEEILCYTNNGGVIFALNVCGLKAFSSIKAGWIVFFSQVVASIITGVILSKPENFNIHIQKQKNASFTEALGKSIALSGSVVVNIIAAFVVFYAVMAALNIEKVPILCGLCELTKGVMFAGEINNLPLTSMFFSFGGFSVFAQTAAFCEEGNLKLNKFYKGKIITAVLSFLITWLYIKIPYAVA